MKTWAQDPWLAEEYLDVPEPLVQCIRASRMLGGNPYLVLHGGGNISVKDEETIFVKASGHDMATITTAGLAPLSRSVLSEMFLEPSMSDGEMMAGFRRALRDDSFPNPSIETLLHNFLPSKFVLHTHADAIVTLTNTVHGEALVRQVLGESVGVIPYCFPGFVLAKTVQKRLEKLDGLEGIVLVNHGLFTMGASAEEAYTKHHSMVSLAENFITEHTGIAFNDNPQESELGSDHLIVAEVRSRAQNRFGGEFFTHALSSPQIRKFFDHPGFPGIALRGPTTLEHVIRTKRVPALMSNFDTYGDDYRTYFDSQQSRHQADLVMLDPSPRVVLDPEAGVIGLGRTAIEAAIAAEVYSHTIGVILAAEALGGYRSIRESDAFDIEYWELEQMKLR